MSNLENLSKILDKVYSLMDKLPNKPEEDQEYCDRCDKLFPVSKLQTFEDSKGNDQLLCESCEHNYPDEPNDNFDEDHNSDR